MQVATGVALVVVGVAVTVTPLMSWRRYDRSVVTVLTTALVVLALAGIGGCARRVRARAPLSTRGQLTVATGFAVLASLACTVIATSLIYRSSWDVQAVESASRLDPVPPYLTQYFGFYPNNIPLLGVARGVRGASDLIGLTYAQTFVLLNGICLGVTLLSVYAIGRLLHGHRAGMVGQVLVVLIVGLSPWTIVPYTDYLAMPMPITAVALVLLAHRTDRRPVQWALVAAAVVLTGVGIAIKPTVAVVLVAFAGVAGLSMLRRPRLRPFLTTAMVGALCVGGALGVAKVSSHAAFAASGLDSAQLSRTTAVTPLTFVAGGLVEGRSGESAAYGIYDGAWAKELLGMSTAQMNAVSRTRITRQLRGYGPARTARFEWDKTRFNWGDGMFWAWGEGHDRFYPVLSSSPVTSRVSPWNHPRGTQFERRTAATNALWFAVLIIAGLGLVSARYRRTLTVLALCTLGIAAFTLVFQGRSRYLFVFVPVVITLAALATSELERRARELWLRRRQQSWDDELADVLVIESAAAAPIAEAAP